MKKFIIILLLLFANKTLLSQTSKRVDSIAKLISKYNKYVSPATDFYGRASIQYNNAVELYKNTDADQLESIISKTSNKVLKLYCFLILKKLDFVRANKLANSVKYKNDSAKVLVQNGPAVYYQNGWSLFQSETFILKEDLKRVNTH